jgi:hypothetical protein
VLDNEKADLLAKSGTKMDPMTNTTSLNYLGAQIKRIKNQEWSESLFKASEANSLSSASYLKNFKPSSRNRIQIPISTRRATASAFYQLKIRHSYLKSYLHLLGYTSNNKCICGAKETLEYLLISCSLFSLARSKLKNKLATNYLSLPLLLNTSPGIEASIAYLSETNICTRKYHLARELVDN